VKDIAVLLVLTVSATSCSAEDRPAPQSGDPLPIPALRRQGLGGADGGAACTGALLANAPFANGDGSTANPYGICTLAQLNDVRGAYLSKSFVLLADIDAGATDPSNAANRGSPWDNGGLGWAPIGSCGTDNVCNTSDDSAFTGVFHGSGHAISRLYVDRPNDDGVGLFGVVTGSSTAIEEVAVTDVHVTGHDEVGAVVGRLLANIDRCGASGTVAGSPSGTGGVGGLVGMVGVSGGPSATRTITRSSSSVNVSGADNVGGLAGWLEWGAKVEESFATGTVSGRDQVGGLVGYMYECTIDNAYGLGAVTGRNCVGGLEGSLDFSTVSDCYARGDVTGNSDVGALIGCGGNTPLSSSFATGNVVGSTDVGGLIGQAWGGSVTSSRWDGTGARPDIMCGLSRPSEPESGCDDTQIVTGDPSYWYSARNVPMSAWDKNLWSFTSGGYPTLVNAFVAPSSAGGGPSTDAGRDAAHGLDGGDSGFRGTGGDAAGSPTPTDAGSSGATNAGGAGGATGGASGGSAAGNSGSSATGNVGGSGGVRSGIDAGVEAGTDQSGRATDANASGCTCRTAAGSGRNASPSALLIGFLLLSRRAAAPKRRSSGSARREGSGPARVT